MLWQKVSNYWSIPLSDSFNLRSAPMTFDQLSLINPLSCLLRAINYLSDNMKQSVDDSFISSKYTVFVWYMWSWLLIFSLLLRLILWPLLISEKWPKMIANSFVNGLLLCCSLSSRKSVMKGGLGVTDAFRECSRSVITFWIIPVKFGIQYLFLKMASVFSMSQ